MVIAALAGRRIDAPDVAVARFPATNADDVKRRIRTRLTDLGVTMLVSAAACGADLLALDAAGELGLRRRIVLPFPTARFRETSVTDRPGPWGELYDRIIDEVDAAGDLVILHCELHPEAAYAETNLAILDEALDLAQHGAGQPSGQSGPDSPAQPAGERVIALAIWDRASRGPGDMTEDFARNAAARGLDVIDVPTHAP